MRSEISPAQCRWGLDSNANDTFDPGIDRDWVLGDFNGAQPVIGDWNGDGRDRAGVFSNGSWFLDDNGNGMWDGAPANRVFHFGTVGDAPMPGRW